MARSILSRGMDSARALVIARRRRALADGSGTPPFAASVISRDSLLKILERFLSWAPLRNWMFLNFEWPAMAPPLLVSGVIGGPRREIKAQGGWQGGEPPLWEALTVRERQLTAPNLGIGAALIAGDTMKQGSKHDDKVMPALSLSELCSEAADHVARARLTLFDESADADRALLHLDEAIFCLKRL